MTPNDPNADHCQHGSRSIAGLTHAAANACQRCLREIRCRPVAAAANIAVILGIAFAVLQIVEARRIERTRVAVEALSPTYGSDFVNSFSKLWESYAQDPYMPGTDSLDDDLLYVMSVYDFIAILYLQGFVDSRLVEERVCNSMDAFHPILLAKKWPADSRRNFEQALDQMKQHRKHRTAHNLAATNERRP